MLFKKREGVHMLKVGAVKIILHHSNYALPAGAGNEIKLCMGYYTSL